MDAATLQTLVVALVVLAAALYVVRRGYRLVAAARRKSEPGCGGDCGCGE